MPASDRRTMASSWRMVSVSPSSRGARRPSQRHRFVPGSRSARSMGWLVLSITALPGLPPLRDDRIFGDRGARRDACANHRGISNPGAPCHLHVGPFGRRGFPAKRESKALWKLTAPGRVHKSRRSASPSGTRQLAVRFLAHLPGQELCQCSQLVRAALIVTTLAQSRALGSIKKSRRNAHR